MVEKYTVMFEEIGMGVKRFRQDKIRFRMIRKLFACRKCEITECGVHRYRLQHCKGTDAHIVKYTDEARPTSERKSPRKGSNMSLEEVRAEQTTDILFEEVRRKREGIWALHAKTRRGSSVVSFTSSGRSL